MKSKVKQISIVTVVAVLGLSAFAFADLGNGYGHIMGTGWKSSNDTTS